MKAYPKYYAALIAAALLFVSVSRADEAAYKMIVRERESVLSQILAECEKKHSSGVADDSTVTEARLALYSFRRDTATITGDKARNQELIVRIFEENLERVNVRAKNGISGKIAFLEAKAQLLEARQLLEEIRLKSGKD